MFGDKEIQDLLNEIGRASDYIDKVESRADDVAMATSSIEEDAQVARDAATDAGRALSQLEMKFKRMIEQPGPDLVMLLVNIEKQLIPLGQAIDEMRRALTGGSDD